MDNSGKTAALAPPISWSDFLGGLGTRCGRAFLEWSGHSMLLLGVFAIVQGFHWCMTHLLGVPDSKKYFDVIKLEWLFDGADLALLVGICVIGVIAAVRSYLGKH